MLICIPVDLADQTGAGTVEEVVNLPADLRLMAAKGYIGTTNNAGAGAACSLQVSQGAAGSETEVGTVDLAGGDLDDATGPLEVDLTLADAQGVNFSGSAALRRVTVGCTVAGGDSAGATGVRLDLWFTRPLIPAA